MLSDMETDLRNSILANILLVLFQPDHENRQCVLWGVFEAKQYRAV
jgi:hypothetical protein